MIVKYDANKNKPYTLTQQAIKQQGYQSNYPELIKGCNNSHLVCIQTWFLLAECPQQLETFSFESNVNNLLK